MILILSKPLPQTIADNLSSATGEPLSKEPSLNGDDLTSDPTDESDAEEAPDPEPQHEEFEAVVSSRHLALSSRVFRVMFCGAYLEKILPSDSPPKRVVLPDDDPDAFLVLLAIIHGRNRRVPRRVSKSQLIEIAILVDKYELHEVCELFTDMWFADVYGVHWDNPPLPTEWIYLSYVFGKADEFKQATRLAILNCGPEFEDEGMPIPKEIASKLVYLLTPRDSDLFRWMADAGKLGSIQQNRSSAINSLLSFLTETVNRYIGTKQQCPKDPHCDGLVLGDLLKQLSKEDLFPIPQASTLARSYETLFTQLRALRFRSLCDLSYPKTPSRPCLLNRTFEVELQRSYYAVSGLPLVELGVKREVSTLDSCSAANM